jgi:hypothetical protein
MDWKEQKTRCTKVSDVTFNTANPFHQNPDKAQIWDNNSIILVDFSVTRPRYFQGTV